MTKVIVFNESSVIYDRMMGARLLFLISKISGVWQWYDVSNSSAISSLLQNLYRYAIHLPASFLYCILMAIEAFKSPDMVQAGNVLYMSLTLLIYNVKLLNIWNLQSNAWKFIKDLQFNAIYELHTAEEKSMWQKEQKKFYILVLIFLMASVFTVVFEFLGALLAEDYDLGYPYFVPFDWRNPRYYWYAYAFDVFGMSVSCISNVSLDMLGCYVIFHIGLLYKLLSMRIQKLNDAEESEAIGKLMFCLRMHRNIRRVTKECEAIVSLYILSQVLFSALIICFSGYRLQKLNIMENLGPFFSMVQFISVMILEIYLPCYFANEIAVNSSMLIFNIYNMSWFQFSVSKRKFLILYMEFLKHSEKLRAGNYFEVGLPIFSKVMNNAYSFFALLLKVDTK